MATLSEKLLAKIAQQNTELNSSNDQSNQMTATIEFKWIPGFRKNSTIVWAHEQRFLYYLNATSDKTGVKACTCYDKNCNARLYIIDDTSAFCSPTPHNHGTHYETFIEMYCYNLLKQKTLTAPASAVNHEIHKEVVQEYVI